MDEVAGTGGVPISGGVLSKDAIKALISKGLFKGAPDIEIQLQPNGFDMTLESIHAIEGGGVLDFDNKRRELPATRELAPEKDAKSPGNASSESWLLGKGFFKVRYNETITLPLDVCAIARPRSTLLRCGATVETAVWDAGYSGRSESLLIVHNTSGLRLYRNARIVQLVFFTLDRASAGYSGVYQNENTSTGKK